jgi:2-methylcitrate dehydratase PrpD
MNISEKIASHVENTQFSAIDAESVDRAKWRVLDSLGCAVAGYDGPGCRAVAELVKKWGGSPESTILVHGIKAPSYNVAMVNSLMTRSYDFEPVEAQGEFKSSPAHISGTTVPAAVTIAERHASSGKDLLCALIIGDDLTARLGVSTGFDFALGWDNTGTINAFGATAIACKIMGLTAKQTVNAFGLTANQISGSMDIVWDKVMTFKFPMAIAAKTGIFSAEMASVGFCGTKDAFLGKFGYFKQFCTNPDPTKLDKDLGKRFYADLVIKPYSACRATHPSIDSALKVVMQNTVNPATIKAVNLHLTPGAFNGFTGTAFTPGETPQVDAAFNIRFVVATALLRKNVKPAFFTDECIRDPRIAELIGKINLDASIPQEQSPYTRIEVHMADGNVFKAETDFPKGDVYRTPLTTDEIKNKFRDNVAFSGRVATDKAEKVIQLVENLEEVKDIREITGQLV